MVATQSPTPATTKTCDNAGCDNVFVPRRSGRPQRFCSVKCRNSGKSREWINADPERARQKWRNDYYRDPEIAKRRMADWKDRNREKVRAYLRTSNRRRRSASGIEYNESQVADRWQMFGNRCWMCGEPATETDHVKPIAAGGMDCLSNLRPACTPCNRSKGARWPFDTTDTLGGHCGGS